MSTMPAAHIVNQVTTAHEAWLKTMAVPERGWTVGDLDTAFSRVKPANNWKNPINTVVRVEGRDDLAKIEESIRWFCGCSPKCVEVAVNVYQITAIGYYAAVGA